VTGLRTSLWCRGPRVTSINEKREKVFPFQTSKVNNAYFLASLKVTRFLTTGSYFLSAIFVFASFFLFLVVQITWPEAEDFILMRLSCDMPCTIPQVLLRVKIRESPYTPCPKDPLARLTSSSLKTSASAFDTPGNLPSALIPAIPYRLIEALAPAV